MGRGDLVSIIKAKEVQIAKLRAQLEEAKTLVVAIARGTTLASAEDVKSNETVGIGNS
jgi:hypothetical protein